jgi:hypothetical protein
MILGRHKACALGYALADPGNPRINRVSVDLVHDLAAGVSDYAGDVESCLAARASQAHKGPPQRVHVAIGDPSTPEQREPDPFTHIRLVERRAGATRENQTCSARAGAVLPQNRRQPYRNSRV